jgi:hypothetical protein
VARSRRSKAVKSKEDSVQRPAQTSSLRPWDSSRWIPRSNKASSRVVRRARLLVLEAHSQVAIKRLPFGEFGMSDNLRARTNYSTE